MAKGRRPKSSRNHPLMTEEKTGKDMNQLQGHME